MIKCIGKEIQHGRNLELGDMKMYVMRWMAKGRLKKIGKRCKTDKQNVPGKSEEKLEGFNRMYRLWTKYRRKRNN